MKTLNRREFVRMAGLGAAAVTLSGRPAAAAEPPARPNVILMMADDMGWGDPGFNGGKVIRTPNLDRMAAEGIRFTRFYSGAPVCSPTRGSCMTGRHPYRYGIWTANAGHMPKEEITLAEALKTQGYATGHFGKWHLGTLTNDVKDGRRGGRDPRDYSPPWENGFDVSFSTEQAVPTWDPMKNQPFKTMYWTGPGRHAAEDDNMAGDDSRVLMDRAIPFLEQAVRGGKPFLAVIWFHAPHEPVRSGPPYTEMYKGQPGKKPDYYGCITALDEQVGRLRKKLADLGAAENTFLAFTSDNGPEGPKESEKSPGSAGPFRGRKRSLYEGGVREPGLLVWPARIKTPRVVDLPCSTSDYFPTVLDILGFPMKGRPLPIDGVSLLPLIDGTMTERPRPIGFESAGQVSLTDNRYKLYSPPPAKDAKGDKGKQDKKDKKGKGNKAPATGEENEDGDVPPGAPGRENRSWELYDLLDDPGETKDLAAAKPDVVEKMRKTLEEWRASCRDSAAGKDYRPRVGPD